MPLIESLLRWKSSNRLVQTDNAPFAIILAPTRELVIQIEVRRKRTSELILKGNLICRICYKYLIN